MTRRGGARLLSGVACLGFLGTAGLHSTGYDSVRNASDNVPGVLGDVMPALWLAFSFDLAVVGLIIGILTIRPAHVARPILLVAALCPLGAASLQLKFIGFVPPTAILIVLGVLCWTSALLWPARSRPEQPAW